MLGGRPQPCPRRGPHREWHARLAAEHVAELRGLVEQRVQAHAEEVHEHDFRHGTQTRGRRAHRHAEEAHLADRRVEDALRAEGFVEPLRGAHDSAPRFLDALILAAAAAGDVLAQQDHVRIHVTPIAELERSRQS
jgi:hypothetical protein